MEQMFGDLFPALDLNETLLELVDAVAVESVHPEAYREHLGAIAADPDFEGEYEFELRSGRWAKRYTSPVRDADGELVGRLFVVRETTREREVEQLKSDLVATVSHELRTPLTGVLGFAELLATRELDPETRQSYLETIHGEARRLTDLINNFLDLQRIEAGAFTLAIESVDLAVLLRREVELHSQQSPAHTLSVVFAERPLRVAADADRISEVVGNLLSNAIKYSPHGGPVTLSADQRDRMARVAITDSGIGIPATAQRKVFTKFFRVDSSDTREIGGTGLGLALCKEIVEAHGGRIGFESTEGKGSTFWFELPLGPAASTGGGRRALVVEDDHTTGLLLAEYLGELDCVVEQVRTGEAALEAVAANSPALVCLDIALPGQIDGWQVLISLKSDARTAEIPVIVCTGRGGRERAGALGAAEFLAKPFSREQLLGAITRVLPENRGLVLVVDDEPSVRRLVVETLSGGGLSFREVADGHAALEAIAEERPDAIVLDLLMPELDGFAVLEALQADEVLQAIPVIVLTGKSLSAAERASLRTKTVSLLEKSGYSGEELRVLIERALAQEPLDRSEQL